MIKFEDIKKGASEEKISYTRGVVITKLGDVQKNVREKRRKEVEDAIMELYEKGKMEQFCFFRNLLRKKEN